MNVCNTFYLCVLLYWCALTGQTDGGQKLLSNSVTRTLHLHTLWHPLTFYGTRFGTDTNTNTNCNNNIPQNPPKNRLPFCRFPTNPWQVILPHLALFFSPKKCTSEPNWKKCKRSEGKGAFKGFAQKILNKSLFLSRMHFTHWKK